MNTSRKGKIARLPKTIRDELNQRLADGEPGRRLIAWLNSLPEVHAVLEREFGGRAISEQNLSEWKTGGYLSWVKQLEVADIAKDLVERASILPVEGLGMTQAMARLCACEWALNLAAFLNTDDRHSAAGMSELRDLTQQLESLRRGDQVAERLILEREWLELEREKLRERTEEEHRAWAEQNLESLCKNYKTEEQKRAQMRQLRQTLWGEQGCRNVTLPGVPGSPASVMEPSCPPNNGEGSQRSEEGGPLTQTSTKSSTPDACNSDPPLPSQTAKAPEPPIASQPSQWSDEIGAAETPATTQVSQTNSKQIKPLTKNKRVKVIHPAPSRLASTHASGHGPSPFGSNLLPT